MRRHSTARLMTVGAAIAGTILLLAGPAAADQLPPSALAGTWQLAVTVVSFAPNTTEFPPDTPGGTSINPLMPAVGHTGTITVAFAPRCTTSGCTLDMTPAGSPGSFSQSGYSPVGFDLPGPGQGPKIGAGDALQFPGFGGFGGPCQGLTQPFEYAVTATVTKSLLAGGAQHVATLRGSEFLIVLGPGCKQVQHARVDFTATNVTFASAQATTPTTGSAASPPTSAVQHTTSRPSFSTQLNRRSALAAAIATPARVFGSPLRDLVNVAIALGAMLFITFPANLFNKTFEENYEDIVGFWHRRLGPVGEAIRRWRAKPSDVRRRLGYAATVVVGAVLGMELNPATSFDLASLTNFLATMATIVVSTMLGFAVAVWFRRRRGVDTAAQVHGLPGGLLVSAACVALSRGANFRPGYLYGVVAGVSFVAALGKRESGQLVALSHVATFGIAIVAWLTWIPVNHAAAQPGSSLALVGVDDVLGSLFVGALVGGTIQLIPLSFMPGRALASWHRGAWSAVFGLTLFTLVAAMLNPGRTSVHPGQASVATAIILLAAFGGGSLLFAGYWARKPTKAAAGQPATAAAETPVAVPEQRRARKSTAQKRAGSL